MSNLLDVSVYLVWGDNSGNHIKKVFMIIMNQLLSDSFTCADLSKEVGNIR